MIYRKLKIEPTNFCNLRCPLCPTNNAMTRSRGKMSFESLKGIIDQFKEGEIRYINLWNFGEPLMNEDLENMIFYGHRKGIKTATSTNSTLLDAERIKRLLSSRIDLLIVCLDGIKKETYEKYRVGSNFEEVVNNLRNLIKERNKSDSKTKIRLQVLLTKDNAFVINDIKSFAREINVDELVLKDVSLGGWTTNKRDLSEKWLPGNKDYSRYENYEYFKIKNRSSVCKWSKRNGTILWNGDVTTCCYDYNGDHVFSNVFKEDFRNFIFSNKMNEVRDRIAEREYSLCKKCQETNFSITQNPVETI
jgi:MoaA/NifB/PqqE/SkfB family radical SAM enzyme